MSTGTQLDMEWAEAEAGLTRHSLPAARLPDRQGQAGLGDGGAAQLTDEEILGLEPVGTGAPAQRRDSPRNPSAGLSSGNQDSQRDSSGPIPSAPRNDNGAEAAGQGMPAWIEALADDPRHAAEAQQLWQEHQAFRAAFSSPEQARALKEMFPGGAPEAQAVKQAAQSAESLREAAQSLDRIDAAIFSGDPAAQSGVVAELARANPAAFRSLFAEAAKLLAGTGASSSHAVIPNEAQRDSSSGLSSGPPRNDNAAANAPASAGRPSQDASPQSLPFDPAAYASFERATNDAVAREVRDAISNTLARVLPDGVAEGAARRIGDDIFSEIHRTLAGDRSLSEQVGELLRGRQFGAAEQQRVASLLSGRARQLVPAVARRVIGEWTSSVLGAARTRAARQAAAASRVDVGAPGSSLDSMPLRPMSPREIDYAAMSDDEILSM